MSNSQDDQSRTAGNSPAPQPHDAGPGWFERLWHRISLKPTSSLRHDIEDALSHDDQNGTPDFSPEERAMLKNILGLRELNVGDVMVPRPDIIAVPGEIAISDVLIRFEEAEHSRLPVYGETIDDLQGMVHIKDLLCYLTTQARKQDTLDFGGVDLSLSVAAADLVREVIYVPPSMPANALLAKMQATHIHMALVIDEYGGTDGLVTIEDLVEMVVGDIEDEHDEIEGPMILRAPDGSLIAQGRAPLDDLVEEIGPDLDLGDLREEVDTVGGLLVTLAGRVPERGEIIGGPSDFDFEVLDADPRRVKRVRIRRSPGVAEVRQATNCKESGKSVEFLPPPDAGAA